MQIQSVLRACILGVTLALGIGLSTPASAWYAYHGGGYYHGGYYHGGSYYGYGPHYYHGWYAPGLMYAAPVYYGCRDIRTCYPNGHCVQQRVCR